MDQKFNNGWRVRIVLSEAMEWEEFVHHWECEEATNAEHDIEDDGEEKYLTFGHTDEIHLLLPVLHVVLVCVVNSVINCLTSGEYWANIGLSVA